MGRLLTDQLGTPEALGLLWEEIADGTIVWRDPSASERQRARDRRQRLFEASNIPWIVNDMGRMLGFYDDIQDVVSFTRWNKKIFNPKRLAKCLKGRGRRGAQGMGAVMRCVCMVGPPGSKRVAGAVTKGFEWRLGIPLAIGLRLFPKMAPVMWLMLAGQVAYSLFGVGLRLGALVGASLEATFRGLSSIGFPFGRDHNKFNQLRRARLLRDAERGWGAMDLLPWEDRLAVAVGMRLGLQWLQPAPVIVFELEDFPSAGNLFSDPFGTIRSAAGLALALLPNAAAYIINDIMDPLTRDYSKLLGGSGEGQGAEPSPELRATMDLLSKKRCPKQGHCDESLEDAIRFITMAKARGLPLEPESNTWLGFEAVYGTLLDIRANLGFGDPRLEELERIRDRERARARREGPPSLGLF